MTDFSRIVFSVAFGLLDANGAAEDAGPIEIEPEFH
jgi:hypothetical protein